MKFDRIQDVPPILVQNLVLFDKDVVKVVHVNTNSREVVFHKVGKSNLLSEDIDHSAWTFAPPRLGMVETVSGVAYITRDTRRQYAVSICPRNALIYYIGGREGAESVTNLTDASFQNMHDGNYKNLKQACQEIIISGGNKLAAAFSRHYAVDSGGHLWFRDRNIGEVDVQRGVVSYVQESYRKYLKEVLK